MRRKTMTQPKTLNDELAEISAIDWYRWADTEDGAIEVPLRPNEEAALGWLNEVAAEHGYRVVLADAEAGGEFIWRLEVA